MLKRTEGIVLKSSTFGEADLIVTYLSRDYGLLKVFAKSPRKIKSRFGSSLEPLTYSSISFIGKEDANLPRLIQSDVIKNFHPLRDNLKCFLGVAEILEMTLKFLPEKESNFNAFNLLLDTLVKLESDCVNGLYYLYYKIRFLEIIGYLPMLNTCGRCGAGGNGSHNFYVSHGSIICERCIEGYEYSIRISGGALKFYRSLLKWNLSNISRIKAPEYFVSEVTNIINFHVGYISGSPRAFRKETFYGIT
mgnify:CR=1 FL=1|jgi:DNA repair protein RecO (recombination protein O)